MAAFGNSYDTTEITGSSLTQIQRGGYTVYVVYHQNTGYYDNFRQLDSLIKEFKSVVQKIAALDNFACRPRERIVGRDYKTPAGTRPYWFRPELSSVDPPDGVSLPRWREYQRRRSA